MRKYLFVVTTIFIFSSCNTLSYQTWNTPYIDTDETLQLYYEMPKKDVLSTLGNPLYVEKGWPDGTTNEIVWVYEVRTQYVASDVSPTGEITIVKTQSSKKRNRPGFVLHKLRIAFIDDKLNYWEVLKEDKASDVSSTLDSEKVNTAVTTTSTSKGKWLTQPKLIRSFNSWNGYVYPESISWNNYNNTYVAGDDTNLRLGLDIGKPILGMLVGFDISFGGDEGMGLMLFADKAIGSWHLVLSMGRDIHEGDYKTEGVSKVGIFKDIGKISYGLEKMDRQGGNLNAHSTFFTMKYNLHN